MRQGSDHALGRSAWQFRVRIESDHEAHFGKHGEVAHLYRETIVLAAQQSVQIEQFTALAFPSHPAFFARIIDAVAMQQKKRAHTVTGIFLVQFGDQAGAQINERTVFRCGLVGVRQIGEQSEMHGGVVVAQKAHFQVFHQGSYLLFIEQKSGYRYESDAVGGNSVGKIELGKNLRRQQRRDQIVHDLHCTLRTG